MSSSMNNSSFPYLSHACALNNMGVSLLTKHCYQAAARTFKDTLILLQMGMNDLDEGASPSNTHIMDNQEPEDRGANAIAFVQDKMRAASIQVSAGGSNNSANQAQFTSGATIQALESNDFKSLMEAACIESAALFGSSVLSSSSALEEAMNRNFFPVFIREQRQYIEEEQETGGGGEWEIGVVMYNYGIATYLVGALLPSPPTVSDTTYNTSKAIANEDLINKAFQSTKICNEVLSRSFFRAQGSQQEECNDAMVETTILVFLSFASMHKILKATHHHNTDEVRKTIRLVAKDLWYNNAQKNPLDLLITTMTFCDTCNKHLGFTKSDIVRHLEAEHHIHVRMGEDSHLAYCNDCHKYLGKKASCFNDTKRALEKHLIKYHHVTLHEGAMEFDEA